MNTGCSYEIFALLPDRQGTRDPSILFRILSHQHLSIAASVSSGFFIFDLPEKKKGVLAGLFKPAVHDMAFNPDSKLNRRSFLTAAARSAAAGTIFCLGFSSPLETARIVQAGSHTKAILVDVERCIACELCVKACRARSSALFPELSTFEKGQEAQSDGQREKTAPVLSARHWLYIQELTGFEGGGMETLNIPRRCKHCIHPPCALLCPVSAIDITPQGAVVIDHSRCIGCGKCRDVCPWLIPRHLEKKANGLAGGSRRGKMYKCDFCHDRIESGQAPSCILACPVEALFWGTAAEMLEMARQKVQDGYHLYGEVENGGTASLYLSPVPFETITKKLGITYGNPHPSMPPGLENPIEQSVDGLYWLLAAAPLAGAAAAFVAALGKGLPARKKKRGEG